MASSVLTRFIRGVAILGLGLGALAVVFARLGFLEVAFVAAALLFGCFCVTWGAEVGFMIAEEYRS